MPAERRKKRSKKEESHESREERPNVKPSSQELPPSSSSRLGSTIKHSVIRMMVIFSLLYVVSYIYSKDLPSLAKQDEEIKIRVYDRNCSNDYKEDRKKFKECAPKLCGRGVMDTLITRQEASTLLSIAKRGLSYGGSNGGASILDLHTGALSKGDSFINIYKYLESIGSTLLTEEDIKVYKVISDKIRFAISTQFRVSHTKMYLTSPTFFSRMDSKPAQTVHDEYWHQHVDKETYTTFDYTSLVYLSDYKEDFEGGRFVFVDSNGNKTVEPRFARLSFFTSGSENSHFVEKVTDGTRYAITVSFTCDKSKAIRPPSIS